MPNDSLHPDDAKELQELRALWHDVRPPARADGDELPPAEREVVDWMQEAWADVAVPPLPMRVARAAEKRRAKPDWSLASLAAAALLIAGAAFFVPLRERTGPSHSTAGGADLQNPDPQDLQGTSKQPGEDVSPGVTAESSPIVAFDSDRIEMRRGSVRLILLRQGEATDGPTTGEPR